jgi:hypothetical protein
MKVIPETRRVRNVISMGFLTLQSYLIDKMGVFY